MGRHSHRGRGGGHRGRGGPRRGRGRGRGRHDGKGGPATGSLEPTGDALMLALSGNEHFFALLEGESCPLKPVGNDANMPSSETVYCSLGTWNDLTALLAWFRDSSDKDHEASLRFASSLSKESRAVVHSTAEAVGLGALTTVSSGIGKDRHVAVVRSNSRLAAEAKASNDFEVKDKAALLKKWAANENITLSLDESAEMLTGGEAVMPAEVASIWKRLWPEQQAAQELCDAVSASDISTLRTVVENAPQAVLNGVFDEHSKLSPLHLAAKAGLLEAMEVLLNAGYPVNARDGNGFTALEIARKFEQCDAEGVLLRAGAQQDDVEQKVIDAPDVESDGVHEFQGNGSDDASRMPKEMHVADAPATSAKYAEQTGLAQQSDPDLRDVELSASASAMEEIVALPAGSQGPDAATVPHEATLDDTKAEAKPAATDFKVDTPAPLPVKEAEEVSAEQEPVETEADGEGGGDATEYKMAENAEPEAEPETALDVDVERPAPSPVEEVQEALAEMETSAPLFHGDTTAEPEQESEPEPDALDVDVKTSAPLPAVGEAGDMELPLKASMQGHIDAEATNKPLVQADRIAEPELEAEPAAASISAIKDTAFAPAKNDVQHGGGEGASDGGAHKVIAAQSLPAVAPAVDLKHVVPDTVNDSHDTIEVSSRTPLNGHHIPDKPPANAWCTEWSSWAWELGRRHATTIAVGTGVVAMAFLVWRASYGSRRIR